MTGSAAPPIFLVLGRTGQIGYELVQTLAAWGTVVAPSRKDVDLLAPDSVRDALRHVQPTVVLNAAAFTDVDRAEVVPHLCARLNADAPALIASECRRADTLLVHFSTDYVFDGNSRTPYVETDEARPLNAYGATKLAGEQAVVSAGGSHLVFRTSWVYSARGRNFPATVLRLAEARDELTIVDDQIGAPTNASFVAHGVCAALRSILQLPEPRAAANAASGVYHMSAGGATTWCEFARIILAEDPRAARRGCTVRAIPSLEHHTPARRPAYSVLSNEKLARVFDVRLPDWHVQWRTMVAELALTTPEPDGVAAVPQQDRSRG